MATERTLCIMKPDSIEKRVEGKILQRLQEEEFRIVAMKRIRLSRQMAEGFYAVHRERPFFDELCTFMSRGPVVVAVLERQNAVEHYRKVIGATDPARADDGTIRKLYGTNVGENAVHGSDSVENGKLEAAYFFPGYELL
jgi:nucleoside-diphosphate kinase